MADLAVLLTVHPLQDESPDDAVDRCKQMLDDGYDALLRAVSLKSLRSVAPLMRGQLLRPYITRGTPKRVPVLLENVDWELLRKQKRGLVNALSFAEGDASKTSGPLGLAAAYVEVYAGLVHLLDHIQDQAALVLGEKAVFGDMTSDPE